MSREEPVSLTYAALTAAVDGQSGRPVRWVERGREPVPRSHPSAAMASAIDSVRSADSTWRFSTILLL